MGIIPYFGHAVDAFGFFLRQNFDPECPPKDGLQIALGAINETFLHKQARTMLGAYGAHLAEARSDGANIEYEFTKEYSDQAVAHAVAAWCAINRLFQRAEHCWVEMEALAPLRAGVQQHRHRWLRAANRKKPDFILLGPKLALVLEVKTGSHVDIHRWEDEYASQGGARAYIDHMLEQTVDVARDLGARGVLGNVPWRAVCLVVRDQQHLPPAHILVELDIAARRVIDRGPP